MGLACSGRVYKGYFDACHGGRVPAEYLAKPPGGAAGQLVSDLFDEINHGPVCKALQLLRVGEQGDEEVLEVGFGTGSACEEMMRRGVRTYVGIEVSEEMLTRAKQRLRDAVDDGRVRLLLHKVEDGVQGDDVLAGRKVDLVFGSHVVYFFQRVRQVLRELSLALKPGGKLALIVSDKQRMVDRGLDKAPFLNVFTPQELAEELRLAGLEQCEVHQVGNEGGAPPRFLVVGCKPVGGG